MTPPPFLPSLPPTRGKSQDLGMLLLPQWPQGIRMEDRRAQPSHDGHMPRGERDTGSATISIPPPPPPLGRGGSSGLGEDGLLFHHIPGLPCPQTLPCPCTPVSLPLYVPVSLQSCVPLPCTQALLPCPCTSVSLSPGCSLGTGCSGVWLVARKDSTFSHCLATLVRTGRDKEMPPRGGG